MKKIRLFSLFLLVCLLFTGCASVADSDVDTETDEEASPEPIQYSVLTYSHNSAFANVEYEFKDTESFSAEPEETKEFTVLGETYEATYDSTRYFHQNYYPTHLYYDSDKGISVEFDHRGYIAAINFRPQTEEGPTQKISRDEAMTKAIDLVNEIMVKEEKFSVDDYGIFIELEPKDINGVSDFYRITFNKRVGEYYTYDYATVRMKDNGEILNFESNCFGMIKKDTEIYFDLEQVKRCVDEKLDSVFKNEEKELGISDVEYTHPQNPNYLIRLKNGTLALNYSVTVKYKDEKSNLNATVSEQISFIVQ
jgi:hypothetical protein